MLKEYSQTIKVYEELGSRYLKGIYDILPVELPEFISLLTPNSKVLDVGCAGGRDTQYFVDAGHDVIGIDVVDVFLKEAKKKVPTATFKKMDLMKLDFKSNTFDAIWAHAVLLHFSKKDLPKILKKLHKVLKPNGLLHVRLKWGKGSHLVKEKLVEDKQRFFTFYYKKDVEEMFRKNGFKIATSRLVSDELGREGVKWVSVWGRKR